MRHFVLQLISLWVGVCTGLSDSIFTNTIQKFDHNSTNSSHPEFRALKKVFLSNRSITCNDGSQAGFYLRKSHSSKKWIIFLEGGWYCYDNHSCRNRWIKQRHFMTSSKWPETKDVGGILSPNMEENPFWFNANHVFIPYCSSDSWSGSKRSEKHGMFSFMGSSIVLQVVRDLIPLGLENSTDLLLTGSSAGGTGVMLNLDFVQEMLHEEMRLKQIRVKGVTDSGWFLDRTPFDPTIKPAVEAIRKGMELWQGKVPWRCRQKYIQEPWRCYFGYRLYPTLKSRLFVFQWLFDEAQMDADKVGAPVTKQQWDYIHKMGDALRHSFQNVSAVFAPSCISHSVLTKRDWQKVKIDDITIAEALHCWEQKTNRKRPRKKLKRLKLIAGEVFISNKDPRTYNESGILESTIIISNNAINITEAREIKNKKRRRRKNKRKRKDRQNQIDQIIETFTDSPITSNKLNSLDRRARKFEMRKQKRHDRKCVHRKLERCSWPQCNHSCPKLHNPLTGEEMDFIELLKSFGLDMESVASALGIDMETLNNMDHSELLNLLTQQAN